jgi:Protein of unknown function (DUF3102)
MTEEPRHDQVPAPSEGQRRLDALAADIRREVDYAEEDFQSAVGHAIRAGQLLIEAKAQVRHGEWLPWLQANCPLGEREARNYMRLARNRQRVADLPSVRHAVAGLTQPKAVPALPDGRSTPNGPRPRDARSLDEKRAERAARDQEAWRLLTKVNGAARKAHQQEAELLEAIERCRDRYAVYSLVDTFSRSMRWMQVYVDAARARIERERWSGDQAPPAS